MKIHREGYRMLGVLFLVLFPINLLLHITSDNAVLTGSVTLVSSVLYLFVVQFFRNPQREQNINENHVLCPADGKIVAIEEIFEDEYYKDKRMLVSVFMTPLNVHVNRYAISGKVAYVKYHKGLYLVASHPKSSTQNERSTVVVEDNGRSILLRQIAGYVARRIVTYAKPGNTAKQGVEFGFIKFGSRVDIVLPLDAKIAVKMGEIVKGGVTAIARF
jgi:phosphatidylserine decarboxylase